MYLNGVPACAVGLGIFYIHTLHTMASMNLMRKVWSKEKKKGAKKERDRREK